MDVRILGPVEVFVSGRPVDLGGSRVRRLLALLVADGDSVTSFDRISDVLWTDPPRSVRQQVHNVVRLLRVSLAEAGPEVSVVTVGTGYRLEVPRSSVDMWRFRDHVLEAERSQALGRIEEALYSLEAALAQWRGEPFSGLDGRERLDALATTLTEERLTAAERLAELRISSGDASSPTDYLHRLMLEYPFRESLRALYMRSLHLRGRQADALTVFNEGRQLLAEELGLDPGPQLRAAHSEVLGGGQQAQHGVPDDRVTPHPKPAAETEAPGPIAQAGRFLPRDILEFTGRGEELRLLADSIRRSSGKALVISAIDGMGGVGKTTLAIHLAHQVADSFPDGQYYIDLLGFNVAADPMPPIQALGLLLRDSGVPPERIPSDLTGRSALWRAQLAGRRAILVLDNAADAAQVRPLLPGSPQALVLVSSRRRLSSLEGSTGLSLDVFPQADALTLFSLIVGPGRTNAERDAAAKVVSLCGCLPLAIQVAAARLRDRPAWSVAYLAEQLQEQRARYRVLSSGDRNVMSVLSWSYHHLTGVQRRVFRLLHLIPGPDFDVPVVAATADLSLDEAAACLEELFESNLVRQRSPDRYQLHDLIRDCSRDIATARADKAEQTLAMSRMFDYFACVAGAWCAPIATKKITRFTPTVEHSPAQVETPASTELAVRALDAEYRNIVAALNMAANEGYHAQVWQTVCALIPYFAILNFNTETVSPLELGLAAAQESGSELGQSMCLMGLAHAHHIAGRTDEARRLAAQALRLSRRRGDKAREINQLTSLGVMHFNDNDFDGAIQHLVEARKIAEETDDAQAIAELANNLAVIRRNFGNLEEAEELFSLALRYYETVSNPRSQTLVMVNLGHVAYLRGKYDDSSIFFERALKLSQQAHSRYAEIFAKTGLCVVRRITRDFSASLDFGREALVTSRDAGIYEGESEALEALGDTYLVMGDTRVAEEIFDQAGKVAAEHGSARYMARCREGQAHVASSRGEFDKARELWAEALETNPGGVIHVAGARLHLAAADPSSVTCWRCVLA